MAKVKIMFLGGVGEIGKNMTAIECDNEIIIIDCGAIFPTEETPGIDLLVPDVTYLVQNAEKIKGLILTHAHEDHIGGIPYLLKEIPNLTIYATKFSHALVDFKLREHKIDGVTQITVKPLDVVTLGIFEITFVNVNHSIPGAVALSIVTPEGRIFFSGDFKIDYTPIMGDTCDLSTISSLGDDGVMLYLGESTNVEREGSTMSETSVSVTFDNLFTQNKNRRIIIATFASNVHRLQQVFNFAKKYNRKVALNGRTMLNVVEVAQKLGELKIADGLLIDITKIKSLRDDELVIISTGSQGEEASALTRMANSENPNVTITSNDTVIISASPIVGNERWIYKVINNLYKLGANVVYQSLAHVHVSGHACKNELALFHTLLRPTYFIPVHGEYRHLKKHAELAQNLGMNANNIFFAEIGSCFELEDYRIKRGENIASGTKLVDGDGIEDQKQSIVLKDRKKLSLEGLFIVSLATKYGEIVGTPTVNSRGFIFDFHRDYDKEIADVIEKASKNYNAKTQTIDELKRIVKKALSNYLLRKTKQQPMIVVTCVEI